MAYPNAVGIEVDRPYAKECLKVEIADHLIRLTHTQRNGSFGLCFLCRRYLADLLAATAVRTEK